MRRVTDCIGVGNSNVSGEVGAEALMVACISMSNQL